MHAGQPQHCLHCGHAVNHHHTVTGHVYVSDQYFVGKDSSVAGHVIAQVVSSWLPTAAPWDQAQVRLCRFCSGQNSTEADFFQVLWFPLPFIPLTASRPLTPNAGTIGQVVADMPSGLSLAPPQEEEEEEIAL
jgi:hypothetical protein